MAKDGMKKNIVQDVIPPKRSIRDVELPSRGRRLSVESREEYKDSEAKPASEEDVINKASKKIEKLTKKPKEELSYKYEYNEPPKSSRKGLYIAVSIFILAIAFGISALFRSATITITPKQETKTVGEAFTAKKNTANGTLAFQLVTTTKDADKAVSATSLQNVSKKARGKIVIYNKTKAQSLVVTTRFQTPEGLVYRLIDGVTVPGQVGTTAGSVEVTVEADAPGDTHNIGLKDFTIPGFKGDPKYNLIYARSKTAMTGGVVGQQKVVSDSALEQADKELEGLLKGLLSKDITSQIPQNFILYPNSLSYSFEKAEQVNGTGGNAVLRKKGTVSGIIFDKGSLSRAIIARISPSIGDSVVKINNLENLRFSYQAGEGFNPSNNSSITFNLAGNANIVWVFDENKLKSDLLGLSKKDGKSVIATYSAIKEAWIETKPFWSQTIPTSSDKVTLENTLQ